jgi:hypothetical protein
MRTYLAILNAKGCALVLHRVFSYAEEIFRSSIPVTNKPWSIFLSCGMIKELI